MRLQDALRDYTLSDVLESWHVTTIKPVTPIRRKTDMMNETPLKPGQVIRYDGGLWRVEHCNPSRAYIVPLAKRHVVLGGGVEFDSSGRGVSIGASSFVEIVEDIERARVQLELEAAERELAAAKREIEQRGALEVQLKEAEADLMAVKQEAAAMPTSTGWTLAGATPACEAGSLKAAVLAFLGRHPGASTKAVAAGMNATSGAVAACLDRFRKSGVVKKS